MKKILTMKKVTKTFGSGHTKVSALKAIDFYVKEGEFVSIIGPSGSGKSTFLTISGGLQTPTSGEIVINGHSLTELPEKKRADLRFKEIGFILQSSNLIPFLTVKEQFELVDQVTSKKEDSYEVVKLLVKEAHEKQKATIMVTHDVRMIQWSDRVYRMEDGYLTEEEKKKE